LLKKTDYYTKKEFLRMETTNQRTPHFKPVEELMYVYKVGHGCSIIAKLRIFGRKFLKTSKL
jgi:hypothetical protein